MKRFFLSPLLLCLAACSTSAPEPTKSGIANLGDMATCSGESSWSFESPGDEVQPDNFIHQAAIVLTPGLSTQLVFSRAGAGTARLVCLDDVPPEDRATFFDASQGDVEGLLLRLETGHAIVKWNQTCDGPGKLIVIWKNDAHDQLSYERVSDASWATSPTEPYGDEGFHSLSFEENQLRSQGSLPYALEAMPFPVEANKVRLIDFTASAGLLNGCSSLSCCDLKPLSSTHAGYLRTLYQAVGESEGVPTIDLH
jgi:hypothetical protein